MLPGGSTVHYGHVCSSSGQKTWNWQHIPFQGLPKLLLSTTDLVDPRMWEIPHSRYCMFHPTRCPPASPHSNSQGLKDLTWNLNSLNLVQIGKSRPTSSITVSTRFVHHQAQDPSPLLHLGILFFRPPGPSDGQSPPPLC